MLDSWRYWYMTMMMPVIGLDCGISPRVYNVSIFAEESNFDLISPPILLVIQLKMDMSVEYERMRP